MAQAHGEKTMLPVSLDLKVEADDLRELLSEDRKSVV
jgi:hypothetical protein